MLYLNQIKLKLFKMDIPPAGFFRKGKKLLKVFYGSRGVHNLLKLTAKILLFIVF